MRRLRVAFTFSSRATLRRPSLPRVSFPTHAPPQRSAPLSHAASPPMPTPFSLRHLSITRLVAAALGLGALAFQACSRNDGAPAGDLVLSGNIEATTVELGFKVPGRVVERLLSDGQSAKQGQLVAKLDDSEQKAQVAVAQAELAAAQAALAELEAGSRPEEIVAAQATQRSAEVSQAFARLEFARQRDLREKKVISNRDYEIAQAQLKVADAQEIEAAQRAKLVEAGGMFFHIVLVVELFGNHDAQHGV